LKEAEQSIRSAISMHPRNPDYFGLLAAVKCDQKEFSKGLEYANEGLAIDPDNLQCLNMRAHALFKLDKKDEAYETIREALNHDPENDVTHANLGWGLLERGDHKKALTHFREALKINPNSDSAKAGLIQGLKARYVFYRWFLRYAFFVTNLKGKYQWALIIGLYIGIQIINKIADSDPQLATILKPIVYVYIAFALSTWIVTPLTNLFLRLNVYGRFALSKDQIQASNFVGVAFFAAVAALIGYLINGSDVLLSTVIVGASLMIPFSSMFGHERPSTRKIFIGLAFFLAFLGILHIVEVAMLGTAGLLSIYAIGVLAYGFAANMVKIKS
jgi:tetratricopeptide (TPR) repeat protein